MTECPICVGAYTAKLNKAIKCERCPFVACKNCVQYHLLSIETLPSCMDCKVPWTRPFLVNNLPRTWVNGPLKTHIEVVLLSQEKSLIPATMQAVEEHKAKMVAKEACAEAKREQDKVTTVLREKYEELSAKRDEMLRVPFEERDQSIVDSYNTMKKEVERLSSEWDLARFKKSRAWSDRYDLKYKFENGASSSSSTAVEERRQFTYPCPGEGCRGFLSTRWKCMVCSVNVCSDCHEIKKDDEEEHTCTEENLQTAKMIKSETKPCPKCGVRIFKTEGCDQMFCTSCHSPFSWTTGKIINGAIHNPHYFEWLQKQNPQGVVGIDQVDRLCGNNAQLRIPRVTQKYFGEVYTEFFETFTRLIVHVREVTMPAFNIGRDALEYQKDLRIKYILNEIDEETWKTLVQRREKKAQKNKDYHNVYDLLVQAGRDMLQSMSSDRSLYSHDREEALECARKYFVEMKGLLSFIADTMDIVAKQYDSKAHLSFTNCVRNAIIPMNFIPRNEYRDGAYVVFDF